MNLWTLVGSSEHACNMACLGSLMRLSRPAPKLWVLGDGTLSLGQASDYKAAGFELLGAHGHTLPPVEELFGSLPELQSARQHQACVKKIVDIPLIASRFTPGARVHYIDSDILFLRPFHFFNPSHALPLFAQSRDVPVSLLDIRRQRRPLHAHLNSGLFSIPYPELSAVEALFAAFHKTWKIHGRGTTPWLWEQSALSYLHANSAARFVPDSAIFVPRVGEDPRTVLASRCAGRKRPFAVHLVRGFKDQAERFGDLNMEELQPEVLTTVVRRPLSPVRALCAKLLAGMGARCF